MVIPKVRRFLSKIVFSLIIIIVSCPLVYSRVIYVDGRAAGAIDGTSWDDAYRDLQSAQSAAQSGDDIWVAAGKYKPTVEIGGSVDRYKAFQLKSGISVYGGFRGEETSREQRDWQVNETILSGDLLGNDNNNIDCSEPTRQDNCYHVLHHYESADLNETAILDGFIIKGGNASGGWDSSKGGGVYNDGGTLTITNCTVSDNSANSSGGGIYHSNGTLTMMNSTISGNSTSGSDSPSGGGLYVSDGTVMVTNSTISENTVNGEYFSRGGGLCVQSGVVILTNSSISSNYCGYGGFAGAGGGGLWLDAGTLTLANSTIKGNSTTALGGGLRLDAGTAILMNSKVVGNRAVATGGGLFVGSTTVTLMNSVINGNSAAWFAGDTSSLGGGFHITGGSVTLTNSVVSGNSATSHGGGFYIYSGTPMFNNTIVAINAAPTGANIQGVYTGSAHFIGGDPGFVRNPSAGADGIWGTIDDDLGDLRLRSDSPCIDTGVNALAMDAAGNPLTTDLDGGARIVGAAVDIGAYEYHTESTDLRVSHVSAPVVVRAGEMFTVDWIVCNYGNTIVASDTTWQDEVHLSADTSWGGNNDLALGTMAHVGGLGARAIYTASLDIDPSAFPGGIPDGNYYILVKTDSTDGVIEVDESNNAQATTAILTMGMPELVLGQPTPGVLPANRTIRYYMVNVTETGALRVVLNDADDLGSNEVYMSYGWPPTRSSYDYRYSANLAADQDILIPDAIPGTYYMMVYGASVPDAPANYTITASLLPFIITSISPNTVGNGGKATVRIRGAHFDNGMTVALVSPTGPRITAEAVHFVDSSELWATFDVTGAALGPYSVEMTDRTSHNAALEDAFTIVSNQVAELWIDLLMPSAVRVGRESVFWIEYGNRGNVDAPAPIIELALPSGTSASLTPHGWQSRRLLQFVGIFPDTPVLVLPPGSRYRVPVYFTARTPSQYNVVANIFDPSNPALRSQTIDWDMIEQRVRPPDTDLALWASQWSEIVARAGSNFGDYMDRYIAYAADRLSAENRWVTAGEWLLFGSAPDVTEPWIPGQDSALMSVHVQDVTTLIKTAYGTWTLEVLPLTPVLAGKWDETFIDGLTPAVNEEWRFLPASDPLGGFVVVDYSPAATKRWASAHYTFRYSSPDLSDRHRWIQLLRVDTDGRRGTAGMDPMLRADKKDDEPFYWNSRPISDSNDPFYIEKWRTIGARLVFQDGPKWFWSEIYKKCVNTLTWIAEVHLVEQFDKEVRVHQGYRWGWKVTKLAEGPGNPTPDLPDPNSSGRDQGDTQVVSSWDPNKKIGPAGFGVAGFVRAGGLLSYTIYFENDANLATAPAQEVRITDPLDPNLGWSTFELTEIAFRDHVISVPAGLNYYATTFDLRPYGENLLVEIEAGLDPSTGQVSWSFVSLDPETLAAPDDPLAGFLPINDEIGRGEGHVSYIIRPLADLPTGTEIHNVANIVFDMNPPITTNQVDPHDPTKGTDPNLECLNTIDSGAPTSRVNPLTALIETAEFVVSWIGEDSASGSGMGHYEIYVSDNDGNYALWISTPDVNAVFTGEYGHTYRFYSVAVDNVGNREEAASVAYAETTVIGCLPTTHSDYDDWVVSGQPTCWCASINPRQCHGDADGKSQGKQKYWVSTNDLDILIAAWNKPFAEIDGRTINSVPLICADFDHKAQSTENYRVSTNDLDILIANFNQANAPAADCP